MIEHKYENYPYQLSMSCGDNIMHDVQTPSISPFSQCLCLKKKGFLKNGISRVKKRCKPQGNSLSTFCAN